MPAAERALTHETAATRQSNIPQDAQQFSSRVGVSASFDVALDWTTSTATAKSHIEYMMRMYISYIINHIWHARGVVT